MSVVVVLKVTLPDDVLRPVEDVEVSAAIVADDLADYLSGFDVTDDALYEVVEVRQEAAS